MKVKLLKVTLRNFKGAKHQTVDFSDLTAIYGMNASGKTRIFDAFTWLLFGKDSEDKKDFNIKTLDENNEPIHKVETSVVGVLSIDGRGMILERIYKEKWIKKRGEEISEFAGHETLYFINEVPHQMKEYQEKVNDILPESIFKQVTNPLYFNSVMKWNERREMLTKMVGDITDSDVIAANPDLKAFYDAITGKSFEGYKKEIAAKKKLLKESLQTIPARIDEVSRAIQTEPDYNQLQHEIKTYNEKVAQIDTQLTSESERFDRANKEQVRKQNRIYELEAKVKELQFQDLSKVEESTHELKVKKIRLSSEVSQLKADISSLKDRIENLKAREAELVKENDSHRKDWSEINESSLTFNENEFICPTCKRQFEADDIEAKKAEMQTSFNRSKTVKLEAITNIGKKNAAEIQKIREDIDKLTVQIAGYSYSLSIKQKEHDEMVIPEKPEIVQNPQVKILQDEIEITRGLMQPIKINNTDLIAEKKNIGIRLDELKKQLNIKEQNESLKARKRELIEVEKSQNQQIADLEKLEFQCEAFTRAKIDMIEQKVNSMFSIVRFKMFNKLINGGTEETCEALINGVPYPDANNAAKIQAGLDIIKTLSRHYDVYAPVFIDNRESVTEIPNMDCQVVSLYVDPTKKELEVINN
jgi:DNA repair protein SbcC/Rad50